MLVSLTGCAREGETVHESKSVLAVLESSNVSSDESAVENPELLKDDLYWTYTALKMDNLGVSGESREETRLNLIDGLWQKGLPESFGPFSEGDWVFTFRSYSQPEVKDENLYFEGTPSTVSLSEENRVVNLSVKAVDSGQETGTVVVRNLEVPLDVLSEDTSLLIGLDKQDGTSEIVIDSLDESGTYFAMSESGHTFSDVPEGYSEVGVYVVDSSSIAGYDNETNPLTSDSLSGLETYASASSGTFYLGAGLEHEVTSVEAEIMPAAAGDVVTVTGDPFTITSDQAASWSIPESDVTVLRNGRTTTTITGVTIGSYSDQNAQDAEAAFLAGTSGTYTIGFTVSYTYRSGWSYRSDTADGTCTVNVVAPLSFTFTAAEAASGVSIFYDLTEWADISSSVKINGAETTQTPDSLTYSAGDKVEITFSSDYFPKIYMQDSNVKSIESALPPFGTTPTTPSTDLSYMFYGCTYLDTVSSDIFSNNTQATSFEGVFFGCKKLATIPSDIFSANVNATDFSEAFYYCTTLSSIPENLFASNVNATSFNATFYSCWGLTAIPEGLFANNTAVTDFSSTFDNCYNITAIPAALFTNNINVTSFRGTFSRLHNITEIPQTLFETNTSVTDFRYTFAYCSNVAAPNLTIGSPSVTDAYNFISIRLRAKEMNEETGEPGESIGVVRNGSVTVPAGSVSATTFSSISNIDVQTY